MWNTSADGARPNLRTKETFSPFTNEGREQKAEGKLWQKNCSTEVSSKYWKAQGKIQPPAVGVWLLSTGRNSPCWNCIPIPWNKKSEKQPKKKGIFNYLKRCLTQQGRVAPATLQQRGWVREQWLRQVYFVLLLPSERDFWNFPSKVISETNSFQLSWLLASCIFIHSLQEWEGYLHFLISLTVWK